jgi:UDP-N-acetylmuramate--alanine ligase
MTQFATSFNQADVLVVTEIYPAGEDPIPGASGEALFEEIRQFGHKRVCFEADTKKIPALLEKIAAPNDMIIVLGAGNINRIIPDVIARLEARN